MRKISFKTKTPKNLSNWLSKFVTVVSDMVIEIDTTNETFVTKTYTPAKDAVKYGIITFSELGLVPDEKNEKTTVDVGILDISKLSKKLNLCDDSESTIDIVFDCKEFSNHTNPPSKDKVMVNYGVDIKIINSEFKLNTLCGSLVLFQKMTTSLYESISTFNGDACTPFNITQQQISRISTLGSFDSAQDRTIKFFVDDCVMKVGNKNFEYVIAENVPEYDGDIIIDIKLLQKLDNEAYSVRFNEAKMVLNSLDTDTSILFSSLSV